jgi:hypothetical protein
MYRQRRSEPEPGTGRPAQAFPCPPPPFLNGRERPGGKRRDSDRTTTGHSCCWLLLGTLAAGLLLKSNAACVGRHDRCQSSACLIGRLDRLPRRPASYHRVAGRRRKRPAFRSRVVAPASQVGWQAAVPGVLFGSYSVSASGSRLVAEERASLFWRGMWRILSSEVQIANSPCPSSMCALALLLWRAAAVSRRRLPGEGAEEREGEASSGTGRG